MSYTFLEDVAENTPVGVNSMGFYQSWGKRLLDIVVVLLILPIAIPILFVVWLMTLVDGGKGIYGQPRVGVDGRIFRCWKIRTMVPNADALLARLMEADAELALEWKANQKLENDPRITRFGRILRAASIDELPQLWNVLTGEMSLIGPRPFTPVQKPIYDELGANLAYYRLRPGISGLWQVKCRNSGKFQERVQFDEEYAKSVTLWNDAKIVVSTLFVILRRTGK